MNIMTIFDIIILLFGVYMIGAAFKMKKSGVISSAVITPEEIASCRDKSGFIEFMYWKEAVFGGIVLLVGILGLVNEQLVSLGIFNIIEMILFVAAFVWFQHQLRVARERFF